MVYGGRAADSGETDPNGRENGGPSNGLRDVQETNRNTPGAGLFGGKIGPSRHPGAAEKRTGIRGRIFRRTLAAT